jgi:hypothetical protein
MPQLLKKIEGSVDSGISSNTYFVKEVSGLIQQEDYIDVSSFVAYLQNFSQCEFTSGLSKPQLFGLSNSFNKQVQTLNISY